MYLDDFLLIGDTFDLCTQNIEYTVTTLEALSFVINYRKSQLIPARTVQFLGFVFNTENMCIELPQDKQEKTRHAIANVQKLRSFKVRTLAHFLL